MIALLKEAGIKANNVLIKAGDDATAILNDFPSQQFNHVIVCVPGGKDTTWLECTSQTVSPGYMGSFTGNRQALLVDDLTSTVVRTPKYTKEQNLQTRHITATIDEEGKLSAKVVTKSTGLQQDDLHSLINETSREEQKKRLQRIFSIPNYDVPAFTYFEDKNQTVPAINETLQIESNDYANITGKRLFIRPNILATYTSKLSESETRENDILYSYPFIDKDSVMIAIPEGYTVEAAPKPMKITNKFGNYSMDYKIDGNNILLQRVYERNSGLFPASDYKGFVDFYNQIYKADQAKMVFVKKE
ncbi:hypothetical protein [Niabella ginsengisoli]|uniref:DUF3858 domain-containing protein n=1 Tax=Niabella ginsengisoli TaxID=522298 RepID=A0ABS9SPT6_9BACT|nr:hypothetical protein [Niabella ginsengisoli]MCH5600378.1 hypothetical protein [Niabella ginsengisoli]